MFAHRPPIESNKVTFFNEVSKTLNKAVNEYDNISSLQANLNFS